MSKTPEEIAAEVFSTDKELRHRALRYIIENFPPHGNRNTLRALQLCFIAGNKTAKAIVEDELQAVQVQRAESPGLGAAEYALKNVLAKMGSK